MAYSFNGTDEDLSVNSLPKKGGGLVPPFTIGAWVYLGEWNPASDVTGTIIKLTTDQDSPNRYHAITITARNSPATDSFTVQTKAGAPTGTATATVNLGGPRWVYVCGRWASTSSRNIRVEGSEVSNSTDITPGINNEKTNIGSFNGSQWWPGYIAEVTVWNIDLTDAEVDLMGEPGITGGGVGHESRLVKPHSIVAYWHLVSGHLYCPFSKLTLTANGSPTVGAGPLMSRKRHKQVLG